MTLKPETVSELHKLAGRLHSTREQGRGYVLFLGGATSTIDSQPAIDALRRQVLLFSGEMQDLDAEQVNKLPPAKLLKLFDTAWGDADYSFKITQMRKFSEQLKPTDGHRALALLLKENYFSMVITSSIDRLIESVFISNSVKIGEPLPDWAVIENGLNVLDVESVPNVINESIRNKQTIFFKLCGDIHSDTYAVMQKEVENKVKTIKTILNRVLQGRDLIIVGLTPMDDVIIQYLPDLDRGKVTYIGPADPEPPDYVFFSRHNWSQVPRLITDDSEISFDLVFQTLAKRLDVYQEYEQTTKTRLDSESYEETVQAAAERPAEKSPVQEENPLVQIIRTEQKLVVLVTQSSLVINVDDSKRVSFEMKGGIFDYDSKEARPWLVDVADLDRFMHDRGRDILTYSLMQNEQNRDRWRADVKREGKRLYKDLIESYADLHAKLEVAQQTCDAENLTLVFKGPREYLSLPYEILHDEQGPLVLRHPFCRSVSGVPVRHNETFHELLSNLKQSRQPLRILLISSNAGNLSADQELQELKILIDEKAKALSAYLPSIEWTVLSSEKASLKNVRDHLSRWRNDAKRSFHIVHYAGHGSFDPTTGENSGLLLWQQDGLKRSPAWMTARELANLLVGSETRFCYLNACVGASTGSSQLLSANEYLGLMDALVFGANIPYVLGFRWFVTDVGSRRFARLFYEYLFSRRPFIPEKAVWRARQQIYNEQATDETWLSPIFVAQHPFTRQNALGKGASSRSAR